MGDAKREQLKKLYPGQGWKDKVNKMSDAQVQAIYLRLKSQGKI